MYKCSKPKNKQNKEGSNSWDSAQHSQSKKLHRTMTDGQKFWLQKYKRTFDWALFPTLYGLCLLFIFVLSGRL